MKYGMLFVLLVSVGAFADMVLTPITAEPIDLDVTARESGGDLLIDIAFVNDTTAGDITKMCVDLNTMVALPEGTIVRLDGDQIPYSTYPDAGAMLMGHTYVFDFGVEIGTPSAKTMPYRDFTLSIDDMGDHLSDLNMVGVHIQRTTTPEGSEKQIYGPGPVNTPEPSTMLLLGLSLLGLTALRKKAA